MSSTAKTNVAFAYLGHFYAHFCTAFYFVIVLALEKTWRLPYHELIELWTLGALLVGVAALPAGLMSDRFGASTMMVVFFLGLGGFSITGAFAESPKAMMVSLSGVGIFAAIYHPVGVPWLVRNTDVHRGKVLGINGVFGTLGSALAGIVSGALIDTAGWQAAFLVPGIVCVVTGLALVIFLASHRRARTSKPAASEAVGADGDKRRVFSILLATMFIAGLIFHATQTSIPKVIEQRHQGLAGEGMFGVGLLVALVYGAAAVMQVIGGHLADRFPLKWVYVGAILFQVPMLWLAASRGGLALIIVATMMIMANASALPAESMLIARYTPQHRHGLVFGLKFVLSFGAAPIAIQLVSLVSGRTGDFYWLYSILALVALVSFCFAVFLPSERSGTEETAPAY